jgi:hypothetical protein
MMRTSSAALAQVASMVSYVYAGLKLLALLCCCVSLLSGCGGLGVAACWAIQCSHAGASTLGTWMPSVAATHRKHMIILA